MVYGAYRLPDGTWQAVAAWSSMPRAAVGEWPNDRPDWSIP